jgi:hypothetical protein
MIFAAPVVGVPGVVTITGLNCHGRVGSADGVPGGSEPAGTGGGPSEITCLGTVAGGVGWSGLV